MRNDGRFETILKTILNGDLSKKEIERRLQEVIDEELSGPLDAPADMELVEKCQSLLWELATNGSIPYPDHAEESKQKLVQKLEQPSFGRRTSFLRRLTVVAAAFVLVCGLSLISIRWITGTSSPDGEQYIVQGHEITVDMIQHCIAEHMEDGWYVTTSKAEVEEYLGFDILVPSLLAGKYNCESYEVNILPIWIQCMCNYAYGDQTISIMIYFLTDVNDTVLFMEQNEVGDIMQVDDLKVYVSENVDNIALTWSEGNIVYDMMGKLTVEQGLEIVSELRRN